MNTTVKHAVTMSTMFGETPLECVKRYANTNYENGWDVVVECCSDEELLKAMNGTASHSIAIRRVYVEIVKGREIGMMNSEAYSNYA